LHFDRWVARQRGKWQWAPKTGGRQVPQLIHASTSRSSSSASSAANGLYLPFVRQGKAVFEAEYELKSQQYCEAARALGFTPGGGATPARRDRRRAIVVRLRSSYE